MRSYEDLTVLREAYGLLLRLYPATRRFPKEERYLLGHQIRSSVLSIVSNLAEGTGRATNGEFGNSVSNASGSAAELEIQLKISRDLCYLSEEEVDEFLRILGTIRRRLYRLYVYLKSTPDFMRIQPTNGAGRKAAAKREDSEEDKEPPPRPRKEKTADPEGSAVPPP